MIQKTILIVDDTISNVDILYHILYPKYDILVATNGKNALEIAIANKNINLILLDIMMPGIDGYEVCTKLKSNDQTKDIPIIFLTSKVDDTSIQKGYELGAIDYIGKPFKPLELLSRVKTQLDIQHLIVELKNSQENLKNINNTLSQKIQIEVEKNRIKDQQMYHQKKHAQMGEIISMIAHQWRQPLNAITLTTNNLLFKCMMGNFDSNEFQNELSLIDDYSQHLSKTIDDFRDFFKNNKSKVMIRFVDIVTSTLNIIRSTLEKKDIEIITDFNCNIEFETYANEVKQVVLNIIKNAEDALVENEVKSPKITIQILCDNNCKKQILLIKDNAGGIKEDIKNKIFEPYFSTKKGKDGTGLGLYMSKIIIEEHCNGNLSVKNDQEGAVFRIEL